MTNVFYHLLQSLGRQSARFKQGTARLAGFQMSFLLTRKLAAIAEGLHFFGLSKMDSDSSIP
jgi:hypothetical protein